MQLDFSSPSHPLHFPFGELRGRHNGKQISPKNGKNNFTPWKTTCKHKSIVLNLGSGFHDRLFVSIILFAFNSDFPFRGVLLVTFPHICLASPAVPLAAPAYFYVVLDDSRSSFTTFIHFICILSKI